MQKRKKNLRKIPYQILGKLGTMDNDIITVGTTFAIDKANYQKEGLSQYGIPLATALPYSFTPSPKCGVFSKRNLYGQEITRKDLPKVLKTWYTYGPNFGDWSRGSHTSEHEVLAWPKEHIMPRNYRVSISEISEDDSSIFFSAVIDTPLKKEEEGFDYSLLYQCNLLQENFGSCDVFPFSNTKSVYIATLNVKWELLPRGQKDILGFLSRSATRKNSVKPLQAEISDRISFFKSINVTQYIRGTQKFSAYIGAILPNGFVLLENFRYGNAIYIFKNNWENFSKLDRLSLQSLRSNDVIRIVHGPSWKEAVKKIIG